MQRLYTSIATFLITFFIVVPSFCQTHVDEITNYYSLPDNIKFNGVDYKLAWSSHPSNIYYKHEYLPKGEISSHFNTMLMLDFVQGDFKVKDAVQVQVAKILERKKTDAVCNYQIIESPDGKEIILDFLMSESKNDNISLIEWNAYHYKSYTDKAGHSGVLLFAISHRTYDEDTGAFLKSLSNYRNENRTALIRYPVPDIQIK